jgi:hypothetical protein
MFARYNPGHVAACVPLDDMLKTCGGFLKSPEQLLGESSICYRLINLGTLGFHKLISSIARKVSRGSCGGLTVTLKELNPVNKEERAMLHNEIELNRKLQSRASINKRCG